MSQRFAAHVALRHRFEYGTFTTYEEARTLRRHCCACSKRGADTHAVCLLQDDDAILRRVLEESAREAGGAVEAAAGGGAQSDS